MSYKILTVPPFDRQLKQLNKKYQSLKSDFARFLESVKINPEQGTALGKNCFKIRLAVKSKGKGKRGGARVITHVVVSADTVYLLSVYDKTEKESLTTKELRELLELVSE